MNTQNLKPSIVFSPGEILLEELETRNLSQSDFAEILGRPLKMVNEIIKGKKTITPESANDFAAALGTSPELWLGLQADYDLYKISQSKKNSSEDVKSRAELYQNFPIKELRKRGWIVEKSDIHETKKEILFLFSLPDLSQWSERCLARFRKSKCGDINMNYVNAWVELGKVAAGKAKTAKFNKAGLLDFAPKIGNHSKNGDGIKEIISRLSDLGVKLIFLPHFSKTRVDGATFWLGGNPVILMSLRYDRVDNFYFTLLHEIGHVVLHGGDEDHNFFDDTIIISSSEDKKEKEANKFAQDNLVPVEEIKEMEKMKPVRPGAVLKKSADLNIHPGILIGVLQHKGLLSYGQYRLALGKVKDKIPAGLIQK